MKKLENKLSKLQIAIVLAITLGLGAAAWAEKPAEAGQWLVAPGSETACAIGSVNPKSGYKFRVDLSAAGSAVRSVKLADYFQTVADKLLFDRLGKNQDAYAEAIAKNPKKYQGHYAVVKTIDYKGSRYQPFETMAMRIFTGTDNQPVAIDPTQLRQENWTLVQSADDQATYEWAIYRAAKGQAAKKTLSLLKTYKVAKGSYSIEMSLRLVNHSQQQLRVEIDQAGPVGLERVGYRADERMAVSGKFIDGKIQPVLRGTGDLGKAKYGQAKLIGKSSSPDEPVIWFGSTNKFFGSMVYLRPLKTDRLNAAGLPTEFFITAVQQSDADRMWLPTMKTGPLTLAPAGDKIGVGIKGHPSQKTLKFDLFVGPKERTLLNGTPLYAKLRYSDVISSGSCTFCTFDWLMIGLMWLLNFFANNLFFGNFGLAIMLLVLIVRLVLHPLTKKGQVAMAGMQKKMAAMQPQIQQIKKKYANDKAAMNAEMAKLYKVHGNPMTNMLGCLPMMLQMPIWIALYSGLNTSVELRHAAFLPVWITDLAAPDQLFTWSGDLPLIGHAFNLLPVLLTVAMFLQQKLSPHASKASASPEQAQQQKMMMFMMPIMMLFFFYNAPSGLTLYIMASTTIGILEQQRIRAHIRDKEAQDAAESQFIDVPGKGPRDSRPKKPKGPLWAKRG